MTTPAYALDADQVQVGTPNGAGIYLAKVGTAPPADSSTAWGPEWDVLGYLSDDGATVAQSTDSEELTPWQSVAPIRSVITSRSVTLQFVLWQLNPMTLALYFDTDVPTEAGDGTLKMDVRTDQAGHIYAVGIDSRDGDRVLRVIFPRASLSDAGDLPLSRGAVVPLDCTLSALETNGSLATIMLGPASAALPPGNGDEGGASARMKPSRNGHTRTDDEPNGHDRGPGKIHRRHGPVPPAGEAVGA